jgi:hypothetical protein
VDQCDGSTKFLLLDGGPVLVDDFGKPGSVNATLRRPGQTYTAKPAK